MNGWKSLLGQGDPRMHSSCHHNYLSLDILIYSTISYARAGALAFILGTCDNLEWGFGVQEEDGIEEDGG